MTSHRSLRETVRNGLSGGNQPDGEHRQERTRGGGVGGELW